MGTPQAAIGSGSPGSFGRRRWPGQEEEEADELPCASSRTGTSRHRALPSSPLGLGPSAGQAAGGRGAAGTGVALVTAGRAPASLPRRRCECPSSRPRPCLPTAGNNWKPGKSSLRRSSRGAESRGSTSSDFRRAGCKDTGGGARRAAQRRRGGRGGSVETYLCPRGAAGRRRAGRARSRAGRRRCPPEGPSRRPRPDAGAGAGAARSRPSAAPPAAGAGQEAAPLRASPRRSAPLSAAPRPAARAFAQLQPQRQWRPRSRLAAKQRHQEAAGV